MNTIYLSESIVLLTVRAIPAVLISIRNSGVLVTKPAVHVETKSWSGYVQDEKYTIRN